MIHLTPFDDDRSTDFRISPFFVPSTWKIIFYYLLEGLWIHKFLYVLNFCLLHMTDSERVVLKSPTTITLLYNSSVSNRFCFMYLVALFCMFPGLYELSCLSVLSETQAPR